MIIKFTRKEALKFFKRRTRRKIKKIEKKQKDSGFKKKWDDYVDEIDHILAFGEENGDQM